MSIWLPEGDQSDAEIRLVVAASSDQRLYLVIEGPAYPPPQSPDDQEWQPDMRSVRVATASGMELPGGSGGDHGKLGKRPRTWFVDATLPPDLTESLTVQLLESDGSVAWEVTAAPA
ncbi:hypothetical protein Cs7R123_42930 [Catellatospora sp. TT07R-123]|nr:hypothetical protein Cs7R123_42930 [Catellatospora sp. TT07R-123]